MKLFIETALQDKVMLGLLRIRDIVLPDDGGDALWQEIERTQKTMRQAYGGRTVGQVPGIETARALYRSIGIDPTKTRPSSEALLRRILKGKSLYRIHPLVDLFNLVSLEQLTPVGLYDDSSLRGDRLTVRLGREGEGYDGIRKDRINVAGRICIADAEGPFGSPTADSLRTAIDGAVSDATAVFYQHREIPSLILERCLDAAEEAAVRHLSATVSIRYIL